MAKPLPQPVRIYRVGGSVRDEILGRAVADRDYVVVGATPELMLASGFRPVGRDFPVFLHPETQEEYALARTERKQGTGHRGFAFFASPEVTLEDDLLRRDLTINAMARDDRGALIDPHGGARDLAAGVLRHVSPAFAEDPLRVLRVARFAARLGFAIAPETMRLMRAIVDSGELATLAAERVWQELAKGLGESQPSRMIEALAACGALRALLPEIAALFDDALRPAEWLELFAAADALRRPERLAGLVDACACAALAASGAGVDGGAAAWRPRGLVEAALRAVRGVDAGAIATTTIALAAKAGAPAGSDAIAKAVRTARLAALRRWRGGPASRA